MYHFIILAFLFCMILLAIFLLLDVNIAGMYGKNIITIPVFCRNFYFTMDNFLSDVNNFTKSKSICKIVIGIEF